MSALAAAALPAGGAPIRDLIILGGVMTLLTGGWIRVLSSYLAGGAGWLRWLEARAGALTGIPGWASVPGLGALAFALLTIWGATWDIGLHIDVGRDPGAFGTTAHYPLLAGLEGMFLMGILAIVMAPERASVASVRLGSIRAPAGALLLATASGFALLGFPLDDLWHTVFGQDVTLWGPTHTMFIGGVLVSGSGAALLLAEGARSAGQEPFRRGPSLQRPVAFVLCAIFLYFWTAVLHEFNFGVPQYRQVWQPLMLSFGAAQVMVLARLLAGRGGTLGALAVWLPMQVAMTLVLGHVLHVTQPGMPLFVAQAALVELLGIRGDPRRPVAFGVVAGLLVGTVGFAADYAWTHVEMPLPWRPGLLGEAIPIALAAAVAGGVLGALMAQALLGEIRGGRRALALSLAATLVVLGLGVEASIVDTPGGVTATIAVSGLHRGVAPGGQRTLLADVTVRLSRPGLVRDDDWAYVLGWQGGGRYAAPLAPVRRTAADPAASLARVSGTPTGAVLRSTAPVPIGGRWKVFVRLHTGHIMLSAPIRMPPDSAVHFAGFTAPIGAPVRRMMVSDTRLLQIERKTDGPLWAWTPAFLLVLCADLGLLALLGAVCVRIGRIPVPPRPGPRIDRPRGELVGALAAVRGALAGARRLGSPPGSGPASAGRRPARV